MILENFQNLHEDGCLECRYDVKAFENSCLSRLKRSKVNCFWKLKGFAKAHPFSFQKQFTFDRFTLTKRCQDRIRIRGYQIVYRYLWS